MSSTTGSVSQEARQGTKQWAGACLTCIGCVDSDYDIQVAAWTQDVNESSSEEKMRHSADIRSSCAPGARLRWPTHYNPAMFHYDLTEREALCIEQDEAGISEWSLDNHIFTLAVYPDYKPLPMPAGVKDLVPKLIAMIFTDIRPKVAPSQTDESCEFFKRHEVLKDKYSLITPYPSFNHQAAWERLSEWLFWPSPSRKTGKLLGHMTEHVSVNFLRAREFDDAMRDHVEPYADDKWYIPYGRVKTWLVYFHRSKITNALSQASASKGPNDVASALYHASIHAGQCGEFIAQLAKSYPPLRQKSLVHPTEWPDVLKRRLLRYPLGGTVDDAVYVPLTTFFEDLCQATGVSTATQLLADISFLQTSPEKDTDTTFKLPLLLVRHQTRRPHQTGIDVAAQNEQRLHCVSAAQFLATLGITGFPVYGLTTCGMEGFVYAAWFSDEQQCLHIADRGTSEHRFDLSTTEGIARYVGFLGRIAERAEELQARFEEVKPALLERVRTEEGRASLQWTLQSQLLEYKLWPETPGELDAPATVTQLQELLNQHEHLMNLCQPATEDRVREDVKKLWQDYETGKREPEHSALSR